MTVSHLTPRNALNGNMVFYMDSLWGIMAAIQHSESARFTRGMGNYLRLLFGNVYCLRFWNTLGSSDLSPESRVRDPYH